MKTWAAWWVAVDGRITEFLKAWWPKIDDHIEMAFGPLHGAIGQAIGTRAADVRDDVERRIEREVRALEAKIAALEQRFTAKLPVAKEFVAGIVHYQGEVVAFKGSTYQAIKDSAQDPSHTEDWICLCHAGGDAVTPRLRGAFDAKAQYRTLDIVSLEKSSYIARYDNPGPVFGAGWQLLAGHGERGDRGPLGPRGNKGQKGDAAEKIVQWHLHPRSYRIHPVMADGTLGPAVIDLRPALQQFLEDTSALG